MATRTPGGYADAGALKRTLERTAYTCDTCGFEDQVLRGEWNTHAETAPHTGNLAYRLTCPDCRAVHTIETTL